MDHKDNFYRYIILFVANILRLYLRFVIMGISFGYCLNLTFKDKNQYYGFRKMSLGNVYSECLKIRYKNNS
jgi:hypothetical protein